MKNIILFILLFALVGCNSTKETRRSDRAEKALKRLTIRFPELAQKDTIRIPFEVVVEREVLDTVVLKADTIILHKDHLKIRYITKLDSVFIYVESEERVIKDTASTVADVIQTGKRIDGSDVPRNTPFDWNRFIIYLIITLVILLVIIRLLKNRN